MTKSPSLRGGTTWQSTSDALGLLRSSMTKLGTAMTETRFSSYSYPLFFSLLYISLIYSPLALWDIFFICLTSSSISILGIYSSIRRVISSRLFNFLIFIVFAAYWQPMKPAVPVTNIFKLIPPNLL